MENIFRGRGAQICIKINFYGFFFGNFEQKIDRFEVFDAKKFQAAQTPVNNASLRTREQWTAHIYKLTLDCCT